MIRSHIKGIGSYVPPKTVANNDLAQIMTTSHEWIHTRSGIEERHFAEEGVYCSDIALLAVKNALKDARITEQDVDFIIFATLSPDHHFPGSACYLQAKMGIPGVACLDVRNQCSGFIYSLAVADAFIKAGTYKNILVVGAEVHSSALNFTDEGRDVAVLFGDGAGAAVVSRSPEEERGILYTELHADGRYARALYLDIWDISRKPYIREGDVKTKQIWPQMDGKTVFKHAVTKLPEVILNTLSATDLKPEDIKYVIPHQANLRINQFTAAMLKWPEEKFLHNIERYGNTTAASIPLLLDETVRAGMVEPGDLILLAAFGAGFTWGTALIRW